MIKAKIKIKGEIKELYPKDIANLLFKIYNRSVQIEVAESIYNQIIEWQNDDCRSSIIEPNFDLISKNIVEAKDMMTAYLELSQYLSYLYFMNPILKYKDEEF